MTSIPYSLNIPNPPNNPSSDVPNMQQNTNSIAQLIARDHIAFGDDDSGRHLQQTYTGFSPGTVLSGAQSSTAFPAAGIANANISQYYFKNSIANFILSSMRAYALCPGAGGITASQSINVVSVSNNAPGLYTIVLNTDVVTGTNYTVFASAAKTAGGAMVSCYTITSATTFTLNFNFPTSGTNFNPVSFSFFVIQL